MSRRITIPAGALVVLAMQLGVTAAAAQGPPAQAASWAAWNQVCSFSHRNNDDPIVFPRQPGRMHDHTYFGNRSTNAFSTPASLRRHGRTTCGERADRAAYWVPTLYADGKAVAPLGVVAQYLRRTLDPVEPFPAGLKMIAGDMHAREAQSSRVTSWSCATRGSRRTSSVPTCRSGRPGGLVLRVAFPDCWDGQKLDSGNHQNHMAYSTKGVCARSHPVEVPALSLFVRYRVPGGRTTELASGGPFSGHADFVNAWSRVELAELLRSYLNAPGAISPPAAPPDPIWPGPCERCGRS